MTINKTGLIKKIKSPLKFQVASPQRAPPPIVKGFTFLYHPHPRIDFGSAVYCPAGAQYCFNVMHNFKSVHTKYGKLTSVLCQTIQAHF